MKSISTIVSAVLLTSTIYAQNINITTGWQLVGTQTAYSNMNDFNKSCIDLVWKYNKNTSTWSAYSPDNNTAQLIADSTTIDTLNNINENDGFWVKANSDCNIVNESVVLDNNISVETGFTQEYLDGKVFYLLQPHQDTGELIVKNIEFRDGKLYMNDAGVGALTYEEGDDYTLLDDGSITAMFGNAKITTVTDEYFTLSNSTEHYFYFDETKAKAELQSKTISVANGFGEKWLDGRTIYAVWNNAVQAFKFENNIQTITPASTLQFPYTITVDGILKVDESVSPEKDINSDDRYQKYKIISIDNTKIFTCQDDGAVLENCDTEDNQQWFFTNKTDAQTFLDSL
jgi:hypothetical protein